MISKRRHYAVIATELYRVFFVASTLLWLMFGDYPQRWSHSVLLYAFGGMFVVIGIQVIIEYARSIKWALKSHIMVTEVLFDRFIARKAKDREIKPPKFVKGRLRYLEAWLFPVMIGVPLLILAVVFLGFSLSHASDERIIWLLIELPIIGGLVWFTRIIYKRKREAKRLGISLTDSMIVMYEGWFIRKQERAARPSSLTNQQKYMWNVIGLLVGVAIIFSGVLHMDHKLFVRFALQYDLVILNVWMHTALRPLALLSIYAYGE